MKFVLWIILWLLFIFCGLSITVALIMFYNINFGHKNDKSNVECKPSNRKCVYEQILNDKYTYGVPLEQRLSDQGFNMDGSEKSAKKRIRKK